MCYEEAMGREDYVSNLDIDTLCNTLGVLAVRRAELERLVCRYLADLATRFERELAAWGYRDVADYAHARLALGPRAARERVRVGKSLASLPPFLAGPAPGITFIAAPV